jgi:RHS repeat-associated protein
VNLLTGLNIDERFTRTEFGWDTIFLRGRDRQHCHSRGCINASATLQTKYTCEAFGKATSIRAVSTNPYRFTGREDDGTGLDYYRARYYNATLQRFVSEDQLGFQEGPNIYSYVLNSPLNLIDPSGLATVSYGVTINGQFGPLSGQTFGGLINDNKGNMGVYFGFGGGPGVGEKGSAGASGAGSNGRDICDIAGPFANQSIEAGAGLDACVDQFIGQSPDGYKVMGGGMSTGVGVGGGGSSMLTYTWVWPVSGPLARRKQSCQ